MNESAKFVKRGGGGVAMQREGSNSSSSSSLLSSLLASPSIPSEPKPQDTTDVLPLNGAADIEVTVDYYDAEDAKVVPTQTRPAKKRYGPEDFEALKVIGTGAYGKVYLVKSKETGTHYAMKVLRKASLVLHRKESSQEKATETQAPCNTEKRPRRQSFTNLRNAILERHILEAIRHPFIVKLYYAFQTDQKLYLVLHYGIGGELFYWLEKQKIFEEYKAAFYSAEILLALDHLHSLSIIYRDLKPENVLLDSTGHILLTDFGLSKVALRSRTLCGTADYMAPEVVQEQPHEKSVDLWSLGILVYDMLNGKPPFQSGSKKKTMESIVHKKVYYPRHISPFAKDLISRLLKKKPTERLGAGEAGVSKLKSHQFFRKINWSRLERLEIDPPFVPPVNGPEDTSNFRNSFVQMSLEDEPPDPNAPDVSSTISIPRQQFNSITSAASPWAKVREKVDSKLKRKKNDTAIEPSQGNLLASSTDIFTVDDCTSSSPVSSNSGPKTRDEQSRPSSSMASSLSEAALSETIQVQLEDLFKGFSFVRESSSLSLKSSGNN